jgi:dTDP-4-dehydrorhamnose 3,5-epimerase
MSDLIQDVLVKPLKLLPNAKGRLMEVQRCDDPEFPGFGQAYITQSFAGIIKAWYRHHLQIDQIAVVSGLVKMVLYDDREQSPTCGKVNEIIMGELAPRLVVIPPLVWHGFQAIGETSAFLLHLNDRPFVADEPDEDRLAPDDPSIPYVW